MTSSDEGLRSRLLKNDPVRLALLGIALLAAACTTVTVPATPPAYTLEPYATTTPSPTPDGPPGLLVPATTPPATPTAIAYVIRAGDTLSQLAAQHGVSLDSLLAANPDLNPDALPVGQTLQIPARAGDAALDAAPTPVPLNIREIACHPTANSATWCFVLVHNGSAEVMENITADVTLLDSNGAALGTVTALLPLDILGAGESLPLSAFFAPPVPIDAQPRVQILTATSLLPGDSRYLPAVVERVSTELSWSGRTAQSAGFVYLPESSPSARLVWVAAVAYDRRGSVVGWRRWESASELAAGSRLPFSLNVSSVAGAIARVEFAVEARP
jgi:LysM repeat protein